MADNLSTLLNMTIAVIYMVSAVLVEETGFKDPSWLLTPTGQACLYAALLTPPIAMTIMAPIIFYKRNQKVRVAVLRKVREIVQF